MKHLETAKKKLDSDYCKLDPDSHTVAFQVQDGPIKEAGLNGLQAMDILIFCKYLFKSLNDSFPCRENSLTITKIEEAIHWQDARTKDREKRKVEGFNKE